MSRLILCLSLLFTLSSCAMLNSVESPKAEVTQVDVTDPTLSDAILLFTVQVANPNNFPLNVSKISYDLKLNNQDFLIGEIDKAIEIAGGGDSTIQLPLKIRYSDLYSGLGQLAKAPTTNYTFEGKVHTGLWSLPIKKAGEFRLSDAAKLLR